MPLKKRRRFYNPSRNFIASSEEAARIYKFIAFGKTDDGVIEIGIVNPQDVRVLDALKFILTSKNLDAKIYLIMPRQFDALFQQYSSLHGEVKEALEHLEEDIADIDQMAGKEEYRPEELTADAPISRVVAVIFKHAFEGRASDIHIEPIDKNSRVRFRVDGVLFSSLLLPKSIHSSIVSRIKILANLKIDESRVPQDGRFRSKISGHIIDFRVSSFPTINGEKIVMRLLDPFSAVKTMEGLGFGGEGLVKIQQAIDRPYGMILITGPTGSGKSTTLQTLMSILNKEIFNLVSLEDPIEYNIEGVNQSQVRPDLGYTFASGLRSILRQDPDIVMVGEIREKETAQLAVHAALTGHLVLTTLHTNNALGVIPRLVSMEVEPYLMPSSIALSLAQRLVQKLCDACKYKIEAKGRAKQIIDEVIDSMTDKFKSELKSDTYSIWEAKGCGKCRHKGTIGRMVILKLWI